MHDAAAFRSAVTSDPAVLDEIAGANPALAQAVLSGELSRLQHMLDELRDNRRRADAQRSRETALMNADMFDVDAQRQIEEEIRMGNVNANMEVCVCWSVRDVSEAETNRVN